MIQEMMRLSSIAQAAAAALCALLPLSSCSRAERERFTDGVLIGSMETPSYASPDGRLTLTTAIERSHADPVTFGCVIFTITDSTGKVLWQENSHASSFHNWEMAWDGNKAVVMKSSDCGNWRWARQKNGSWKKKQLS